MSFGSHVLPVCLPHSSYVYGTHNNITITGWGKMGYEGGEGMRPAGSNLAKGVVHLREAQVPIISRRQCIDEKVRAVINWLGKNMGYNCTREVRPCGPPGPTQPAPYHFKEAMY